MNIKKFIKENYKFILLIILIVVLFNLKLPYYILAPGGTINVTDRVEMEGYNKDRKGSLNMLYVSEYEATPASYVFAKLKDWDTHKNDERQIADESLEEIEERNRIMRDNSLDIAMMVAYTEAEKEINIKSKKNVVTATTSDNGLKVGDIILKVDEKECENIDDIKKIINSKEVGDKVVFDVLRGNKEIKVESKIYLEKVISNYRLNAIYKHKIGEKRLLFLRF